MGALFCYVAWWDTRIDQYSYIKQISHKESLIGKSGSPDLNFKITL
jgi:hypothetical protein